MYNKRRRQFRKLVENTIRKVLNENENINDFDGNGAAFKTMIADYHAAVSSGDVNKMVEVMKSSANDPKFMDFLASSKFADEADDDAVPLSGTESITCSSLAGTQMEIDWDKSVAFAFGTNGWNASISPCLNANEPVKPGGPVTTANGTHVLDGHHRWSGCFSINPNCEVATMDFTFPENLTEKQKLVALHSATAVASGNPAGFKGSLAGEYNIGSMKDATPAFDARIGTIPLDQSAGDKPLAGNTWIAAARENPLSDKAAKNAGFASEKDAADKLTQALDEAEITNGGWKQCPFRSVMMTKIISNMALIPNKIKASDPGRDIMPQGDNKHMFSDPDSGPQQTADVLATGQIHIDNDFDPDAIKESDSMTESINLDRWNKLAGLLKD